jgi:hypothetical protein
MRLITHHITGIDYEELAAAENAHVKRKFIQQNYAGNLVADNQQSQNNNNDDDNDGQTNNDSDG